MRGGPEVRTRGRSQAPSLGPGLMAVLVTGKALVLASRHLALSWWTPIAYFWHDAVVALVFTAIEAAMTTRRAPGTKTTSAAARAGLLWTLYAVITAYVVLNVPVMRVLATPMTWPMWRAARGPLADSIRRYATIEMILLCSLVIVVAGVAPILFRRVGRLALVAGSIPLIVLGPTAAARIDTQGFDRNAWTALVGPVLRRANSSAAHGGWSATGFERAAGEDLSFLRGAAAGRHVVLVSLESTAAQHLGLYGADRDPMPNLTALARQAIVFDHAYTAYPESINGLYSLLCSTYPARDRDLASYAQAPCSSIAGLLARRGYRTALFHSGRFGYLGMDAVARNRGYEVLADAGDIGGAHESSFGVDESSTVARILSWIDRLPGESRLFVTYLPIAGHHPYDTPAAGPFGDGDDLGRYRNALHYADHSLGTLMRGLDARGLTNRTILIVLGDHGEAFGTHDGNYGHTFQLFEENVHVPLVLAAPGVIGHQVRSRQVVSLIDVAPTVQDLLGDAVPSAHEGRSMLDGVSRMAFFFTDYSRPLAGLRDGRFKAIHELDSRRTRLFDLNADPGEQSDVAAAHAERVSWYARNLRNWANRAGESGRPGR
jgi:glucan phosphoethanolaminetransferase (alkaline phosphatase superfamily)